MCSWEKKHYLVPLHNQRQEGDVSLGKTDMPHVSTALCRWYTVAAESFDHEDCQQLGDECGPWI